MTTEVLALTDRQKREIEFYEQFVSSFDEKHEVDLSPVSGQEMRPWNSYWEMYHLAGRHFHAGAILLDFGSGPGENALRFSELGYQVKGFDICESNVVMSKRIFEKYSRSDRGDFKVAVAEKLPYPDDFFDYIAGVDILHHVDIERSLKECKRVMKSDGVAVFREPIEVPVLDSIRNTWLVKLFSPKEKSLELHITEDERKLNSNDLQIARSIFPDVRVRKFFILARIDRYFRKGSDPRPSVLEKIDYVLMNSFPFLRYLGGVIIVELRK